MAVSESVNHFKNCTQYMHVSMYLERRGHGSKKDMAQFKDLSHGKGFYPEDRDKEVENWGG